MSYRHRQQFHKWLLYSLVLAVAFLVQTTLLNRVKLLGVHPMLLPVCVAAVAMLEEDKNGAAFGLGAGLLWVLVNGDQCYLYLVALTLAGAVIGGLGASFFSRTWIASIPVGLIALAMTEGLVWLFGLAVGTLPMSAFATVLIPVCLVSTVFAPVIFLLVSAIYRHYR